MGKVVEVFYACHCFKGVSPTEMFAAVDGFVWDGGFVTAHFWRTESNAEPVGQLMHFLVSKSKY